MNILQDNIDDQREIAEALESYLPNKKNWGAYAGDSVSGQTLGLAEQFSTVLKKTLDPNSILEGKSEDQSFHIDDEASPGGYYIDDACIALTSNGVDYWTEMILEEEGKDGMHLDAVTTDIRSTSLQRRIDTSKNGFVRPEGYFTCIVPDNGDLEGISEMIDNSYSQTDILGQPKNYDLVIGSNPK